jgi:hypothetical protein
MFGAYLHGYGHSGIEFRSSSKLVGAVYELPLPEHWAVPTIRFYGCQTKLGDVDPISMGMELINDDISAKD